MDDDLPDRLKNWADKMGYVHRNGSHFDSSADFSKLCKNKTRPLWENVIAKVKPLPELDHIRKNILLSRIRRGTHLQPGSDLSGALGQEVKRREELKQLQGKKQVLMDKIDADERAIKDIEQELKKKYALKRFQENLLKEVQLKSEMLRLKKAEADSLKSWLDDTHNAAKSFCASNPKVPSQKGKDAPSAALEKCIKLVGEYQAWCQETATADIVAEDDLPSEQEKRKVALWEAVSSVIGKIPAEQVWHSMLNDFMERSVSEMASLASSVDMCSELDALRETHADVAKPEQNLSAVYIKTMVMASEDLVKAKILKCQMAQILEQKASEIAEKFPAELNVSKSSVPSSGRILDVLKLRCRLVELRAAKEALTEAVAEMKLETRDLSSCAQRLKEEKEAVARLDHEIAEVKLAVEQGLLSMSDIGNKLKKAQQGVLDELNSFADKCSVASDVVSSSGHDETLNGTRSGSHRMSVFNSTAVSAAADTWACSTPAFNKPNCPEFLHLNESCLTIHNDSIDNSSTSRKSFREIVSTLKNALGSESKSFCKLPLDLVPKLKLSSSMEDVSGLLTESPALIARLSCPAPTPAEGLKPLRLLSPSPMAMGAPALLLHVFHRAGHVRAARLQHLASGCSPPTALCAALSQQYLTVTAPGQDAKIREQLENVMTVIENAEGGIAEGRDTFNHWVRSPVQGMLPSSLLVEGKSLKEWKNKYDSFVVLLR